jgi:hypothetical protein
MARVSGPLFSMTASGALAEALVYSKWKGREYVRQFVIPQNPQTAKQLNVRKAFTLLVEKWQSLGAVVKETWDTFAGQFRCSGFNSFVSRGMEAYVIQLGTSTSPTSVTITGDPPADVWTWA